MKVDKVAAMQGISDIAKESDTELCNEVRRIMSRISKPGEVRRAEFDLNEFLLELSKIKIEGNSHDVGKLFVTLGESLSIGLSVADR
jgi:hypothetical protein